MRADWRNRQWVERGLNPFHWREAALCVPALPLLLGLGLATGHAVEGAIAAGAAFSVGFGAARELRGQRWAAMIAALGGMIVAAFAGTVLGQHSATFVVIAALAAGGCAALALYDETWWWVTLQVVIALLVAGYFEGPPAAGVHRAGLVLAGGLVQLAMVRLLARIFPAASAPIIVGRRFATIDRGHLARHVLRAMACVVGCLLLIRPLGLANGYWAPMTALIVLKPNLTETRARGLARLGGTMAGCLIATGYAALCRDEPALLLIGASVAAGSAYALQRAHYASLTLSITATVVLFVSLGATDPLRNAEHRLIATAIGGMMALLVALVRPPRRYRAMPAADRVGETPAIDEHVAQRMTKTPL